MTIEATVEEDRRMLAQHGFIRVDYLVSDPGPGGGKPYIIEPLVRELGRFDMNGGICAIVTLGGEMWISVNQWGSSAIAQWVREGAAGELGDLIRKLAPKGQGVNVPYGDSFKTMDILARHANPDWMPEH